MVNCDRINAAPPLAFRIAETDYAVFAEMPMVITLVCVPAFTTADADCKIL